ncbi:MAG: nucleotide exchange factor GrpE [Myxococcota bacterium]|jgi:molecular chaperone GrpE (heat shock protein)|nr:nucleotide exchange factor GrpE [Myxococcota bacterium]
MNTLLHSLAYAALLLAILLVVWRWTLTRHALRRAEVKLAEAASAARTQHERQRREHLQAIDAARRELLSALLSLDEVLQRSKQCGPTQSSDTLRQLEHQLELLCTQMQLERIQPSPGSPFDPSRHEAIARCESPDATVPLVQVVERDGFLWHRGEAQPELLRAARVLVAMQSKISEEHASSQHLEQLGGTGQAPNQQEISAAQSASESNRK